jgi:tetratricopeptide (TPR) repeat protein
MDQRIEDFLDHATEGLRDDVELRLDARAELATHAEAKLLELEDAGIDSDEAIKEAVESLGEPVELAADLYEANRRRMNLRAQLRIFMRFALVPIAILAAVWASDLDTMFVFQNFDTNKSLSSLERAIEKLSDHDQFIMEGDLSRTNKVEQQKAIWESDTTNRGYFGNYFNNASCHRRSPDLSKISPELLETARQVDPDNALYIYIEALREMGVHRDDRDFVTPALRIRWVRGKRTEESKEPPLYEVLDRERLDRGMALVEQALDMPHYNDYALEMANLRLPMLSPPERMIDHVARVRFICGHPLSPLGPLEKRHLARTMIVYGDLLMKEGDFERAEHFLGGWEKFMWQLISKADLSVNVLTACAISKYGYDSAAVYRAARQDAAAERMVARTSVASTPLRKWIEFHKQTNFKKVQQKSGGLLTLGTPAAVQVFHASDFSPSRRLQYTVVTEITVGIISAILLLAILGCILVSLRWRFSKEGHAIPVLLVPPAHTLINVLSFGVVLPGLIFLSVTRWVPWSGHEYSLMTGFHKLASELSLLAVVMLVLPVVLGARTVRKRCRELDIPAASFNKVRVKPILVIGALALLIVWLISVASLSEFWWKTLIVVLITGLALTVRVVLKPVLIGGSALLFCVWLVPTPSSDTINIIAISMAVIMGLTLAISAIAGLIQGLGGRKEYGLFYGTFFRSLIPVLAGVVVLLNLTSRPILRASEAKYLWEDTLFDLSQVNYVKAEADAVERLRSEIQSALLELETMP